MGYLSDVKIALTKKGWDYVKKHAREIYENKLRAFDDVVSEDGDHISVKKNGITYCYHKEETLIKLAKVYEAREFDDWVIVGWDCVKWLGYNFEDQQSIHQAIEESGEPAREIAIGEDNQTEEYDWNGYYDNDDHPTLEATCMFDYDGTQWEEKNEQD